MYVEIENTFFQILFWVMWFLTDAIILFFAIMFLLNFIQKHKKIKWGKVLYHDVFIKDNSSMEIIDKEKVDDK